MSDQGYGESDGGQRMGDRRSPEKQAADVQLAVVVQRLRAFARSQNAATERDLLEAAAAYDLALYAVAGDWRPLVAALLPPLAACTLCDTEIPPGAPECPECGPVTACTRCRAPFAGGPGRCLDCAPVMSFGSPCIDCGFTIPGTGRCIGCAVVHAEREDEATYRRRLADDQNARWEAVDHARDLAKDGAF